MKDAQKHLASILSRIKKDGCVLMFDFDGTLAPIVSDPRRARMRAQTFRALEAAARLIPVAIITGRALSDVRSRVPISGISLAGNHGLEWSIRGKSGVAKIPPAPQRALRAMRARLRPLALRYPGIYLEDKIHSLSMHYRRVPSAEHAAIRTHVKMAAKEIGDLRVLGGILLINILPEVRRDKGTAAREMYASLRRSNKVVPIFIGDDVTDEDAFRSLKRGITIRVGRSSSSAASYYLESVSEVSAFLRAIAEHCSE